MSKVKCALASIASLCMAASVQAETVDIKITNLTQNLYFTPLLVAAHDRNADLFEVGQPASKPLQIMAEGGNIEPLVEQVNSVGGAVSANPADGLLAPAKTAEVMDLDVSGQSVLSLVGMILPTNDGFVGLDAWQIPKYPGTYTVYINAYDAGTEANDERITGGGEPGVAGIPADPSGRAGTMGTGVTESETNTTVHVHPGNLGDTNTEGGVSDLDSRVHRWLNPVAKVVITVKR